MPRMPDTLKRSPSRARRLYATVLDSAEKQYGSGERASRTAMAALKHSFEKVGDHWEAKRQGRGKTYGGVDAIGNSRAALYERARSLKISGRSNMSKDELAQAIARRQGERWLTRRSSTLGMRS